MPGTGCTRCWTARATRCGQPRAALRAGAVDGQGVDDGTDVQPRGLAEIACLVPVGSRHGDDQVVAVDDDLRTRYTQSVDPGADDLLRLRQRLFSRPRPVRCPCGQRDPGTALQVDAELGVGLLVAGEEHQQIDADEQDQENRQVTARVHRRRWRCHVLSLLRSCAMRFGAGRHPAVRLSRPDQFDRIEKGTWRAVDLSRWAVGPGRRPDRRTRRPRCRGPPARRDCRSPS